MGVILYLVGMQLRRDPKGRKNDRRSPVLKRQEGNGGRKPFEDWKESGLRPMGKNLLKKKSLLLLKYRKELKWERSLIFANRATGEKRGEEDKEKYGERSVQSAHSLRTTPAGRADIQKKKERGTRIGRAV